VYFHFLTNIYRFWQRCKLGSSDVTPDFVVRDLRPPNIPDQNSKCYLKVLWLATTRVTRLILLVTHTMSH